MPAAMWILPFLVLLSLTDGKVFNTTEPDVYIIGGNEEYEQGQSGNNYLSEKNKIGLVFNLIGGVINMISFIYTHRKTIIKKYWKCCKKGNIF